MGRSVSKTDALLTSVFVALSPLNLVALSPLNLVALSGAKGGLFGMRNEAWTWVT